MTDVHVPSDFKMTQTMDLCKIDAVVLCFSRHDWLPWAFCDYWRDRIEFFFLADCVVLRKERRCKGVTD